MLIGVSCMVDERFSAVTIISARPESLAELAVEGVVWAPAAPAARTAPMRIMSAGIRRYEYIEWLPIVCFFSGRIFSVRSVATLAPPARADGGDGSPAPRHRRTRAGPHP